MNNYLAHYGVLGMKWGRRKGSSGSRIKKPMSLRKKAKNMSDEELQKQIKRLQLEKQYKQLKREDVSAGSKFVKDVGGNIAKQTVVNSVTKYTSAALTNAIESVIGKKSESTKK